MDFLKERIGEILKQLRPFCYPQEKAVLDWKVKYEYFPIMDEWEADTSQWKMMCLDRDHYSLCREHETWFAMEAEIEIPEQMVGMPVELNISTGKEGEWDATNPQIAAYINGCLRQGLDVNHRNLRLTEKFVSGEHFRVNLLVYTGEHGFISEWSSKLRGIDERVRNFYYDILIPWQCLDLMNKDSREYGCLLRLLNDTVNILDFRGQNKERLLKTIEEAEDFLQKGILELPKTEITASCIGHTHIDVAWLWTLKVTQEKAARSFSTVLNLMERYPEYLFMSSQPQLYLYVKKNQPKLYERIREKVKEGRWEAEGAMFLEADCNLTSGESLVRQIVYGKQFFHKEFGVDNTIMWLPDVFGYSAAFPQIMKKCGVRSFMTTKISWNETNKIPFDSFWWEGIDGTKILTHFITTRDYTNEGKLIATNNEFTTAFSTNYNGYIHPSQIKGAWQRYQQKDLNDNVLISFGYGDGGGGPTEEMLETARRLQDGRFGCPRVKIEKAGAFFDRLHKTAEKENFPVWSGELYLEYHRGTYTSMANMKRANRKSEFALLNAETWSVLAERYGSVPYPKKELMECWEILMRNQFHDILPGSAIAEVYEDSVKEYEKLQSILKKITQLSLKALTEQVHAEYGNLVVFNGNGMEIDGIAVIPEDIFQKNDIGVLECDGEYYPIQRTKDGTGIFYGRKIPAKGWKTFKAVGKHISVQKKQKFFYSDQKIETPFYRMKWNEKGQITSLYDLREDRELIKKGCCANVLMTFEDKPHQFDNWNIFEYYKEKKWQIEELISAKVTENGPVRIALEFLWKYFDSTITETFYFYADSPRIDICGNIDWREDQILLKAVFPLELNARDAVYEIQYGNVKRSTTKNTSWEQARFEVCFQKWMDISEYGYGVSFLTDCKYGVSVDESVIGLTLLKSGCYPNPEADRGIHKFTYSVFPHKGDWQSAGTVREAYELNNPLQVCIKGTQSGNLERCHETMSISEKNIVAEVLKKSEDEKSEVWRLYECQNRRTKVKLSFPEEVEQIKICNMLEEVESVLNIHDTEYWLEILPFEIITLKIIY